MLNGIAYDAKGDRLFVTGKLWPRIFEIPGRAPVTWTTLLLMLLVHGITAQAQHRRRDPAQRRGESAVAVVPRAVGIRGRRGIAPARRWDASTGANVLWTVTLPGLAHSSPIVWGDRVFVTSAVSSRGDATFKPGLYGEGTASEDRTVQRWIVMAHRSPDGQDRLAAHGVRGRAAREAAHQGDLRQRHAGNRRPLRRRVLRLAGALRLRHATASWRGRRTSASSIPAPTTCPSTSGARRARRSSTRTW